MTTSNSNVTVTINDQTITADIATIAALLNMACEASMETAQAKPEPKAEPRDSKAQAKAREIRSKHDAILDTKRVERMTRTALGKLQAAGSECKARKQGKWVWVYPTDGKGRTPEFKSAKLPKGWKHSMKRGAFYRDFSQA